MPAVQTTYNPRIAIAVPGMVRSMVSFNAISRFNEGSAALGFGLAVGQGSADKGCVIGGALAGFLGVAMKDITLPTTVGRGTTNIDKFLQYDHVGILTRGEIWVRPDDDVDVMGDVYYVSATGVFTPAAGAGIVGPIVGAHWGMTASGGELAWFSLGVQK